MNAADATAPGPMDFNRCSMRGAGENGAGTGNDSRASCGRASRSRTSARSAAAQRPPPPPPPPPPPDEPLPPEPAPLPGGDDADAIEWLSPAPTALAMPPRSSARPPRYQPIRDVVSAAAAAPTRSEERRVGNECRCRGSLAQEKKTG